MPCVCVLNLYRRISSLAKRFVYTVPLTLVSAKRITCKPKLLVVVWNVVDVG